MKNYLSMIILLFLFRNYSNQSVGDQDVELKFSDYSATLQFQNINNNMRVYYFQNSQGYSFTDFNLNSPDNTIEGQTYFFTNWNSTSIVNSGIWGGIGFGSDIMENSDYVIFMYLGNDNWNAYDAFTRQQTPHLIQQYSSNNVLLIKKSWFTNLNPKDYGYTSMFYFSWVKQLNNPNNYNWTGFTNWKNNKAATTSAFGYLNQKQIQGHSIRSQVGNTYLVNGSNQPSFSDNNTYLPIIKTPTGDSFYSLQSNWIIPFYDICSIFNYNIQPGVQLYFKFNTQYINDSIMILDFRIDKQILRGVTYFLTTLNLNDILPNGIYCGFAFGDTLNNAYSILFNFSLQNNAATFTITDTILDSTGSINYSKLNNNVQMLKSGWFILNSTTKKQRFFQYNSLWATYWEINMLNQLSILQFDNFFQKNTTSIIGVSNLNNQENKPIFLQNLSKNIAKLQDGFGMENFNFTECSKINSMEYYRFSMIYSFILILIII